MQQNALERIGAVQLSAPHEFAQITVNHVATSSVTLSILRLRLTLEAFFPLLLKLFYRFTFGFSQFVTRFDLFAHSLSNLLVARILDLIFRLRSHLLYLARLSSCIWPVH